MTSIEETQVLLNIELILRFINDEKSNVLTFGNEIVDKFRIIEDNMKQEKQLRKYLSLVQYTSLLYRRKLKRSLERNRDNIK